MRWRGPARHALLALLRHELVGEIATQLQEKVVGHTRRGIDAATRLTKELVHGVPVAHPALRNPLAQARSHRTREVESLGKVLVRECIEDYRLTIHPKLAPILVHRDYHIRRRVETEPRHLTLLPAATVRSAGFCTIVGEIHGTSRAGCE